MRVYDRISRAQERMRKEREEHERVIAMLKEQIRELERKRARLRGTDV